LLPRTMVSPILSIQAKGLTDSSIRVICYMMDGYALNNRVILRMEWRFTIIRIAY